jgi:hypothetical protein
MMITITEKLESIESLKLCRIGYASAASAVALFFGNFY